ncbi:hypothetical protein BOX15_Mlig026550g4 [Macrostomum lignano]|uniref:DIX domain-containing protein n=2 Tax=Macrostomum lignano TaxID=282301 RepID=A0A1I8H9N9_9PLAT|nr:hypothetical protein BOX15_Mlig026550g4 [Macrostomum lignano]
MDWSQQVPSYTAWVNSQLKKRPGYPPVKDLTDPSILNGTSLAVLIETVAGVKLEDIIWYPIDDYDREQNILVVLDFMRSRRIRMHRIEPRAVMSGDVKAVMRLILALAAHYKPASVRHQKQAAQQQQAADGATLSRARKKLSSANNHNHNNNGEETPASGWLSSGCNSPRHGATPTISAGSHASSPTAQLLGSGSTAASSASGNGSELEEARSELKEMRSLILRLQDALSSGAASPMSAESNCSSNHSGMDGCFCGSGDKMHQQEQQEQQQQTVDELTLKVEELQYTLRYSEQRREMAEREAAAARNDNERLRRLVAEHQQCVAALSSELDRLKCSNSESATTSTAGAGAAHSVGDSAGSEAAVAAQCISRLRLALPPGDTGSQVVLDTLEHALHLSSANSSATTSASQQSLTPQQRKMQLKRLPLSAVPGFPIHRLDVPDTTGSAIGSSCTSGPVSTRCLYYTERSAAPYLLNIPKPIGQVTLGDIKRCIQLPPNSSQHQQQPGGPAFSPWRYLFKVPQQQQQQQLQKPTKMEVADDNQVVPVWEDKIVVWVVSSSSSQKAESNSNGFHHQQQQQRGYATTNSSNGKKYYHHGNGSVSVSGNGGIQLLPPGHQQQQQQQQQARATLL